MSALQKAHPAALCKAGTYDEASGSVMWTMSTGAEDRDGEFIDPKGWVYPDSVPLLWGHRGWGAHRDVIGRVTDITKTDDELVGLVTFTRAHEAGREVEAMVADGTLRDGSVGFDPRAWENKDGTVGARKAGERFPPPALGRRYTESHLAEFSVVPVPSNVEAGVKARLLKAFGADDDEVDVMLKLAARFTEIENRLDEIVGLIQSGRLREDEALEVLEDGPFGKLTVPASVLVGGPF